MTFEREIVCAREREIVCARERERERDLNSAMEKINFAEFLCFGKFGDIVQLERYIRVTTAILNAGKGTESTIRLMDILCNLIP